MPKINLREYYYWYKEDVFVEVSDEVVVAKLNDRRYENAYRRRTFYNKAHYSLDASDGIESKAIKIFDSSNDPEMLLELKERHCNLCRALNSLSDIQGRRIEAHFILGKKRKGIAEEEGVAVSSVSEAISRGLRAMKKYMQNHQKCPKKCFQSDP